MLNLSTTLSFDRVILTEEEGRICTWVGRQRYANAIRFGRDAGKGPSADGGDQFHIRGAHCEFAASLMLNLSWRPHIGETRMRDVGGLVEIRSTEDDANGHLIVKPSDSDYAPFALVICYMSERRFRLAGWLFGGEAKKYRILDKFGDPAHFVPQDALRAANTLVRSPFPWIPPKQSDDERVQEQPDSEPVQSESQVTSPGP